MTGRVAGKVALITGGARGQGRADAARLAQEGADVVAIDVCAPLPGVAYDSATPEDLEETARQVEKLDRRIVTAQLDVRDLDALRAAVELAEHRIRVNSVHPTGVNTPMGSGDMQAVLGRAMAGDPRLGGMFTKMLPVEGAEPEDVADTVPFLASDESSFITAHEIAPNTGVTEF